MRVAQLVRAGLALGCASAPTLRDAVLRHGGEAQEPRQAFARLTPAEQEQLLVFLRSL